MPKSHKEIAIKVEGVYKDFRLPHDKSDTLKSVFVNPFNKRRKLFERQHALKDISFEIPKGEFFGIVGRNGSGKSTLLKIIAGIYKPTKGSISVSGRLVPFIELGVGFNPELTGRENVYLNGALMGFSEKEVDEKYNAIVDFAELERFMDQKLKNYSSGMQVRLAFSVATVLADSEVLLIDEVLAVGDADFQRKCFEYFKKLKKDKKTVVFVSHDMSAIREYCDRAVLIDNSKLVYSGSADDTAKEYTRLFMPEVYESVVRLSREDKYGNSKRQKVGKWGVGGVDIVNLSLDKKVYQRDDAYILIEFTTKSINGFSDEIIPGVTIKNEKGEPVCGTNSQILLSQKKKVILESGSKIHTVWKVPNIFNEGTFYVEPAVISMTTSETLQWWDDAIVFKVINEEKTPYMVAPKIELSFKKSS